MNLSLFQDGVGPGSSGASGAVKTGDDGWLGWAGDARCQHPDPDPISPNARTARTARTALIATSPFYYTSGEAADKPMATKSRVGRPLPSPISPIAASVIRAAASTRDTRPLPLPAARSLSRPHLSQGFAVTCTEASAFSYPRPLARGRTPDFKSEPAPRVSTCPAFTTTSSLPRSILPSTLSAPRLFHHAGGSTRRRRPTPLPCR